MKIRRRDWRAVEKGMTYAAVVTVLGVPGTPFDGGMAWAAAWAPVVVGVHLARRRRRVRRVRRWRVIRKWRVS